MKKQLLTLAFVALATVASYAQGTIAFGNSVAARVGYKETAASALVSLPVTTRALFGVFWGTSAANLALNQGGALGTSSSASAGIITAPSVYGLTGSAELQTVFIQIRGWDAALGADGWASAKTGAGAFYGETDVRQVTLGPTAGPGQVIWQGASGVNANRFNPLVLVGTVPEPSTIALGVLGLGSVLLFRRRK